MIPAIPAIPEIPEIPEKIQEGYDNYIIAPSFLNIHSINNDLDFFKHIRRILLRFNQSGEINDKLLLNKFIILSNLFKIEFILKKLDESLDDESMKVANSVMIFLKMIPYSEKIQTNRVIDDIIRNFKHRYNLP
jgi:hypothetical protein